MPTYRYFCRKCKQYFEVQQKMTDKPLTEHKACCGIADRVISSNIAVTFKGTGFASND